MVSRLTTTYSWGHVSRYVTCFAPRALAIVGNSMMCGACRGVFSTSILIILNVGRPPTGNINLQLTMSMY